MEEYKTLFRPHLSTICCCHTFPSAGRGAVCLSSALRFAQRENIHVTRHHGVEGGYIVDAQYSRAAIAAEHRSIVNQQSQNFHCQCSKLLTLVHERVLQGPNSGFHTPNTLQSPALNLHERCAVKSNLELAD